MSAGASDMQLRRRSRWMLGLCVGVALTLGCGSAWAQDKSAEALDAEINELLERLESEGLNEKELARLDDLLARYEQAVEQGDAASDEEAKTEADVESPADEEPADDDAAARSAEQRDRPVSRPGVRVREPRQRPVKTPSPTPAPKEEPTSTRVRRRSPRATPAPTVAEPRDDEEAEERPSVKRRPPRGTTSSRDRDAQADRSRPGSERGRTGEAAPLTANELQSSLNVDAAEFLKPFNEREYSFSIKDGTYEQLIENFARMASLQVFGDAPAGTVTFVSLQPMDFKTALGRVQMKLFTHPEQYWIQLKDNSYLEIFRVTEGTRLIELDKIFPTVEQYRAANLDSNDLVMLLYTPESGSIADLEPLRDFMPDYVRIAQYQDQNALTVFGLVRDVNKYLELVDIFKVTAEDPRHEELIPVEHVAPSDALETLKLLMDGFDGETGAPARSRRAGQPSVAEAQAESIDAIAMDEYDTLLVRAMPSKIKEIKRLLTYIDRPLPSAGNPVIVKVQNTDAGTVLELVDSLMNASKADSPPAARRTSSTARRRVRKRDTGPAAAESDNLTMIEWPAENSIVLIGTDEAVIEARALIERFDVADDFATRSVKLETRDAEELTPVLIALLKNIDMDVNVTAHPSGDAVIISGARADLDEVEQTIAMLDKQTDGPEDKVHTIRLENQTPSELIPILTALEGDDSNASTKGRRRSTRRTSAAGTSKFKPDGTSNVAIIFVNENGPGKFAVSVYSIVPLPPAYGKYQLLMVGILPVNPTHSRLSSDPYVKGDDAEVLE